MNVLGHQHLIIFILDQTLIQKEKLLDADDVEHDECMVPRSHTLTSFVKAHENKTTTKWLACSRFALFEEGNVVVLISENTIRKL